MSDVGCPVCGAALGRSRPLVRYPAYGECRCGLIVRTEVVTETYEDEYFDTEDPDRGHRDFTSDWANEYDRRRFGRELERLELDGAPARLIDIGAATGGYVALARERGWDADGVEPSPGARRIATERGVGLFHDLQDLPSTEPYDVATLHHVLEHVDDPVALLRAIRPRLRPDGRLLVEVPNWRSTERVSAGPDWVDLRPEQHRWHFTVETLTRLIGLAGYVVIDVTTLGDPMPSPGTVVQSLGLPTSVIRRRRTRTAELPGRAQSIRGESEWIVRAAGVIDRLVCAARLGKRLLLVAAPQRAGVPTARHSTTP